MNNQTEQTKCPKCGDFRQTEVTNIWGNKIEIFCNTCGEISIVSKEIIVENSSEY